MLEFTEKPTISTVPLDTDLGDSIYALIKSSGSVNKAIEASVYDPENIIAIEKEVERILGLRWKQELVTPAEYNEEWEIVNEAVYQDVEISSDIISVETVLEDFPLESNDW